MFNVDFELMVVRLDPDFERELTRGNLCPSFKEGTLFFDLSSDILGQSTQGVHFRVTPASTQVSLIDYKALLEKLALSSTT